MTHTENLEAFVAGGELWGLSQALQAVANEKSAAAAAIGATVQKKSYTLKNGGGEVVGNLVANLKLVVVDDPSRVELTSWPIAADGLLVLPVGVIATLDTVGYQQDVKTVSDSTPEDWVLVSNS